MKKGRMQEAWQSVRKIRHTELQAARDLYYAYVQYLEEAKVSCLLIFCANDDTILKHVIAFPGKDLRATLH